jgi:hypothetical protein
MVEMSPQEIAFQMYQGMNLKDHAKILKYKIPANMSVTYPEDLLVIHIGHTDTLMEHFNIDGPLYENDTLESKINDSINNTYKYLKNNNIDVNIQYYKEYVSKYFNFQIYVRDVDLKTYISRTIMVFFIEPVYNDLYQFSVSTIMDKPKDSILGFVSKNDPLFIEMYEYTKYFIESLCYI